MSWFVLKGVDHPVSDDACIPYQRSARTAEKQPRGWLKTYDLKEAAQAFIDGRQSMDKEWLEAFVESGDRLISHLKSHNDRVDEKLGKLLGPPICTQCDKAMVEKIGSLDDLAEMSTWTCKTCA